jgi:outer membrane protein TolC
VLQTFSQVEKQTIFTAEAFIQQIKFYHPVVKQANILLDKANAELLSAKGGLDPTLKLDASRKTFDGKNYYHYSNPEFTIPTPVGVNIKTGLENNGGAFLNDEATRGKTSYLGLQIPLTKGLLMDERRAMLQQAKIFQNQSRQERLAALNDLLFDAYSDYFQWAGSFQLYSIYSKFVAVANNRLRLVRIAYVNGDRAMMDTIEAFTQLQNYELLQSEALLRFNNASLKLSKYLWQEDETPLELPSQYLPDTIQFSSTTLLQPMAEIISKSALRNPLLKSYELKLDALEVERRLKFQSLLPTFNVNANLLNKNYYVLKGLDAALFQNNYKWGVELKMPLFFREGRGSYRLTKLKIKETDLQLNNKQWEVENNIRSYYNENILLQQQLKTVQSMYSNYQALLRNEELKFSQGESSLFIINSRETKALELLEKQIELRIKYFKSAYAIQWSAGMLQ